MDETMLNQQMQDLIRENCANQVPGEPERPTGYAWMLQQAEEGAFVPVPLYRELWAGLQNSRNFSGVQKNECGPDPEDSEKPVFKTDVAAVACPHAAVFAAGTLKKDAILNPDVLPIDPKTGKKSWGMLLDDVYRNRKHHTFAVDGKALRGLDGEGYIAVSGMPLNEAKRQDAGWREQLEKACCTRYLNRLGELAVTPEEKQYVLRIMAKAQLLKMVFTEQLIRPEKE